MAWDESYDLVIVGSGGGSITAALAAKACGRSPVIIEKQAKFGGSTAYSGGILWIPNNPVMVSPDSHENARIYLDGLIGDAGPASSPARRDAYISQGPAMMRFLQSLGMKFRDALWPDYYSSAPGGVATGRSAVPPLFDIAELGEWEDRLARFGGLPPMPVGAEEYAPLSLATRTWRGRFLALRVAGRMLYMKLTGKKLRGTGNALQGRLLQIALRQDIPILLGTPLVDLVTEGDAVKGVVVQRDGKEIRIEARDGVLLNSGGFSHNAAMRERYQPKPASTRWTLSNPGDTGEVIGMAMGLGAAIDLMNESWWVPSSFDGDGNIMGFHVPNDVGKPHAIVVNRHGKRFANEAGAYMEFGQRMYANDAVPAWAVLESRNRAKYFWGMLPPGKPKAALIESGYMKTADTIEGLAEQCGIEPSALRETVNRFNRYCETGVDEEFGRGASVYNRYNGDPRNKPNANLGKIERGPFYAVQIQPSDVGTCGGLMTDEHARVLREDGTAIPGLYAAGNCTASVMGRRYLGAGASIGPAFVFGFIAARHACGANA